MRPLSRGPYLGLSAHSPTWLALNRVGPNVSTFIDVGRHCQWLDCYCDRQILSHRNRRRRRRCRRRLRCRRRRRCRRRLRLRILSGARDRPT